MRSLISNSTALLIAQFSNYILPFILIPYLTRIIGADLYGVLAYGLAISQIALVITDYGFTLSAVQLINRRPNDKNYINELIGAIFILKIFLFTVVTLGIGTYIAITEKYQDHRLYLSLILLSVLGQTLQPMWLFQALEKLTKITFITVIARLSYVGLTLALISQSTDYWKVGLTLGITQCLAAIFSWYLIAHEGYKLTRPKKQVVLSAFRESTEFFWSRAAVSTYTAGSLFILGLAGAPREVGIYSAAEQIYKGIQSLFSPLAQSLYPHMTKTKNYKLLIRIVMIVAGLAIAGALIGLAAGEQIIHILFGDEFAPAYPIVVIFLATFVLSAPSTLLGYPLFGALGNISIANKSVMFAGIMQLVFLCALLFMNLITPISVAVTVLCVEALVLASRIIWGIRLYRN